MPIKKNAVKSAKTQNKLAGKSVKKKLPEIKHRRILRPDSEQLAVLEKAIYHSFKMTFKPDDSGASQLLYDGQPVKGSAGNVIDLNHLFKLIVSTYATL